MYSIYQQQDQSRKTARESEHSEGSGKKPPENSDRAASAEVSDQNSVASTAVAGKFPPTTASTANAKKMDKATLNEVANYSTNSGAIKYPDNQEDSTRRFKGTNKEEALLEVAPAAPSPGAFQVLGPGGSSLNDEENQTTTTVSGQDSTQAPRPSEDDIVAEASLVKDDAATSLTATAQEIPCWQKPRNISILVLVVALIGVVVGLVVSGVFDDDSSEATPTVSLEGNAVVLETFYGERPEEKYGSFVVLSRDGSTLAVSSRKKSYVKVFRRNGDSWNQLGLTLTSVTKGDQFGRSMDLSADGSVIIVGGYKNDDREEDAGYAKVYRYSDSQWNSIGQDLYGRAQEDDQFGWYVEISDDGTTVAISGRLGDPKNITDAGYVRIYTEDDDGWVQLGEDLEGDTEKIQFGRSLGMSSDGRRLAVGAQRDADFRGRIRVFDYQTTTKGWTQIGQSLDGENEEDWQGTSVALSGDSTTLAIGADGADYNGERSGMVRVYTLDGALWSQKGQSILGEETSDQFGSQHISISSTGEFLVVGANHNDKDRGKAYLFQYNGSFWNPIVTARGTEEGDLFGLSVTVSGDGKLFAVGGPQDSTSDSPPGYAVVIEVRN